MTDGNDTRELVKAILMDASVGNFGMYAQFAEPKADAIAAALKQVEKGATSEPEAWNDGYNAGVESERKKHTDPMDYLESAFSTYKIALKCLYKHRADQQGDARLRALEEAAGAVCSDCAKGTPVETWCGDEIHWDKTRVTWRKCLAEPIRALATAPAKEAP